MQAKKLIIDLHVLQRMLLPEVLLLDEVQRDDAEQSQRSWGMRTATRPRHV